MVVSGLGCGGYRHGFGLDTPPERGTGERGKLTRAGSVLRRRHGLRIPLADALVEVSPVGEQRRAGRAEAEHSVFDRRLALAHGIEEGSMVFAVRVVVFGRHVFVFLLWAKSVRGGV